MIHRYPGTVWLLICAFFILLGLSGCVQDYGGITEVRYSVENGEIFYKSGKEAALIEAEYTRTGDDVAIKVSAGDVKAFEGQAIQADRIKAQTEAITDGILSRLGPALCAAGVAGFC